MNEEFGSGAGMCGADGLPVLLACSSDCTLCEEVGRCQACREQTYLMEGYCTPNCGPGYHADQKTRTCQGDDVCLN